MKTVLEKACFHRGFDFFNPIQDDGRVFFNPTNFSLVTSTNVGISLKNFLTFSFNPFDTLV